MADITQPAGPARQLPPPHDEPKENMLSNILAIIGFIILIVIVIWGLVHLASLSGGWFTSLFNKPAAGIQVTVPTNAVSGEPITITWKHSPTSKGNYAFLYQCKPGAQFVAPGQNGAMIGIPCGAAFTAAANNNANNSISVVPLLTGTSTSIGVPVSIIFIPSATGTQAQGTATITIRPGSLTMVPTPSTPTTPTPSTGSGQATPKPTPTPAPKPAPTPAPKPVTAADLTVRIIAVGVIDPSTGTFVNRYPTSPNDMVAVQFDIANDGGSATGAWYFNAQLPTASNGYYGSVGYNYTSPMQASLRPGDHIVNTLRFTQLAPGGGTFSVNLDPANAVRESSESNNRVSKFITGQSYNPNQYPSQYQYPYSY